MKGKQHTYQSYGNVYKSTAELFEPSTVEALSQILKHAQAAERRVSVAGGFNSFDGQNAGGDLVISMRKFDSMQYDATNHIYSLRV